MTGDLTILTDLKEGLAKSTPCVLSFFPEEILITKIDPAKRRKLVEDRKAAARKAGEGRMKAALAGFAALTDYAESLRAMDRQAILAEGTERLARSSVRKLSFKPAGTRQSVDGLNSAVDEGKLVLKTSDGRLKFTHRLGDSGGRVAAYLAGFAG